MLVKSEKKHTSLKVKSSTLSGMLALPPSKSHSLRAILFASLAKGRSQIVNPLLGSPDIEAMIEACKTFGASFEREENSLFIEGIGGVPERFNSVINAGNSGIILRFLTALGAVSKGTFVITGDHSICHRRPMKDMIECMRKAGAHVMTLKGDYFAPLVVDQPVQSSIIHLKGKDSQPVSAFLIASALLDKETKICVEDPCEKPWVELTLSWLRFLKVPFKARNDLKEITVYGRGGFQAFKYKVPGDLSTLAFPVLAAIASKSSLVVSNVNLNDSQGDKIFIEQLKSWGSAIFWDANQEILSIDGSKDVIGGSLCIKSCIDALPALAAIAPFLTSSVKISGIEGAKDKESDRVCVMLSELQKLGAHIREVDGTLIVFPGSIKGAVVKSHADHRVAMSLACAALGAIGETVIEDVDWIEKTFPNFIEAFRSLGANFEVVECIS